MSTNEPDQIGQFHDGAVYCFPAATVEATILACHPDGDRLAIALSDRRVVVVEVPQVQPANASKRRGPGPFGPPAVPAGSSAATERRLEDDDGVAVHRGDDGGTIGETKLCSRG